MQSLLSTIHSSLSQTRSAFALRVFVSYDALGRCKQSVVVDIEQPRPPTKHAPLYTIRLLSPAAPLSAATRSATAPLAPATPPSANPPNRTASSPSDTALSPPPPTSHTTQSTSAPSVPSHTSSQLKRARSPTDSAPPPRPCPLQPVSPSPSFYSLRPTSSFSSVSSSPSSAAVETPLVLSPVSCAQSTPDCSPLPLSPCGTEDAVDAEMGGAGSGVADVRCVDDSPPTSTSTPGSGWSSTDAAAHAQCQASAESAALDKRRLKAKEKKRRQKEKRKAEAEQARQNEEKQERKDDPGRGKTNTALRNDFARHRRLIMELIQEREEMAELGLLDEVDWPEEYDPDHPAWQEVDEADEYEQRPYDYYRDGPIKKWDGKQC